MRNPFSWRSLQNYLVSAGVYCLICVVGILTAASAAETETPKSLDAEIVQKEKSLYPHGTYKEIKPGQLEPGAEFPILAEEMEPKTPKIEKMYFTYSGYGELKPVLKGLDANSAEYRLKYYNRDVGNICAQIDLELQMKGGLRYGKASIFLEGEMSSEGYALDPQRQARLLEAGLCYEFLPLLKLYAGKKILQWGQGYAWTPTAFVERSIDPHDPTDKREGYYMLTLDYTTHYTGDLKTFSVSPVFFPVIERVNEKFGERHALNFAGKLYFLWKDTDINLLFLIGGSQSIRYGLNLARKVASNLEVYCEGAYIHNYRQEFFNPAGQTRENVFGAGSLVMGLKYGAPSAMNVILEYYHDSTGYNVEQMRGFYSLIDRGFQEWEVSGDDYGLKRAETLEAPYTASTPMQDYLGLRLELKEPDGMRYFYPAISGIYNFRDKSFSLAPEATYTEISNLEIRALCRILGGERNSENGEKPNPFQAEIRARIFF